MGRGEYSNVDPEDGHLDEIDFETIKNFGKIICGRNRQPSSDTFERCAYTR
jgi:hypothetical protein